jgi:hypothetical protein
MPGMGFDGSGYGLARRYPRVTRGTPYSGSRKVASNVSKSLEENQIGIMKDKGFNYQKKSRIKYSREEE